MSDLPAGFSMDTVEQLYKTINLQTDTALKRKQDRFEALRVAFMGMTAGAAIFAAGAAFMKLFGP